MVAVVFLFFSPSSYLLHLFFSVNRGPRSFEQLFSMYISALINFLLLLCATFFFLSAQDNASARQVGVDQGAATLPFFGFLHQMPTHYCPSFCHRPRCYSYADELVKTVVCECDESQLNPPHLFASQLMVICLVLNTGRVSWSFEFEGISMMRRN
ncbi:hypothetical protein Dimus_026728 [Dionaea muscipula]